jgi:hypothetical protein
MADGFFSGAAAALAAQLAGGGVFRPGVGKDEGADGGAGIAAAAGLIAGSRGIPRVAAVLPNALAGVDGEGITGLAGRAA